MPRKIVISKDIKVLAINTVESVRSFLDGDCELNQIQLTAAIALAIDELVKRRSVVARREILYSRN